MADTVRVLIAKDAAGVPRVLRTDSAFVAHDVREVGTTDADELGIVGAREVGVGVHLWEGTVEMVRTSTGVADDFAPEYAGKLRPVRVEMDGEIAGLFRMEPPDEDEDDREITPDNR
jgi:hypothetical protein